MKSTQTKQKVYLASPFFSPEEEALVRTVAERLRTRYEVFVPMEHEIGVEEDMPHAEWARAIFQMDVAAIREADFAVVALTKHAMVAKRKRTREHVPTVVIGMLAN